MTTSATYLTLNATGVQTAMNAQQGASGISLQSVPEVSGSPVGATNPLPVARAPSAGSSFGVATVSTPTVAGSLQVKASAGNLYGFQAVTTASNGFVMLFDASTVPADGTVAPRRVYPLPAGVAVGDSFDPPLAFVNGILLVFSSTGPFTKTLSATAFLAGEAM